MLRADHLRSGCLSRHFLFHLKVWRLVKLFFTSRYQFEDRTNNIFDRRKMTVINTNVGALMARTYATQGNSKMSRRWSVLSSGQRINSAADDAAGLAVANKMESQQRGIKHGHAELRGRYFSCSNCRKRNDRGHNMVSGCASLQSRWTTVFIQDRTAIMHS